MQRRSHRLPRSVAQMSNKTVTFVLSQRTLQSVAVVLMGQPITPDEAVMLEEVVFSYFDGSQCGDVLGACPLKFRHF